MLALQPLLNFLGSFPLTRLQVLLKLRQHLALHSEGRTAAVLSSEQPKRQITNTPSLLGVF